MAFGRGGNGGGVEPAQITLKLDDMFEMASLLGDRCGRINLELGKVNHPINLELDVIDMHLSRARELFNALKSAVVPLRAEAMRRYEEDQKAKAAQAKPN